MSPIDILLDVAIVGSIVAVRLVPARRARYVAIAVMAAVFAVIETVVRKLHVNTQRK